LQSILTKKRVVQFVPNRVVQFVRNWWYSSSEIITSGKLNDSEFQRRSEILQDSNENLEAIRSRALSSKREFEEKKSKIKSTKKGG